jgi:SpoVK/Ycf46/Vps4 family AAA+-type ATPase
MKTTLERLKILINSHTPVVVVETVEEGRALALIRLACSELNLPLFEWSIADGLVRAGGAPKAAEATAKKPDPRVTAAREKLALAGLPPLNFGAAEADPRSGPVLNTLQPAQMLAHLETLTLDAAFVLKDFHRHMDDHIVVRRLREVAQEFARSRRTIIITAPEVTLPPELEKQVEFLELPMPDAKRLREIASQTFHRLEQKYKLRNALDEAGLDALAANMRGLTEEEAERTVAQVIVQHYGFTPAAVTDVLQAKKEVLRRSDMLEFIEATDTLSAVGGLENLKKWLHKRRGAFDQAAREFGLEPPKGVIIMGVQGCGKSLCARAIAGEWKLPLVRLDTSAIYDKYIGETEKRIKKVFRVAEQLAPAVLWIDELEKVFAGSGPDSASVDAGVSSRILGSFLSWMQDRKAAVFVAATSNNVTVLPPELIRKGRFDEIFFVDLPNSIERRAILELHLKRRKQNVADFDLAALVAASRGYSGAELDAAVQGAMYAAFGEKARITTELLLLELRSTVPLSVSRAEDIARLRAWAKDRAVPGTLPEGIAAEGR